jgi:hypothetical protein
MTLTEWLVRWTEPDGVELDTTIYDEDELASFLEYILTVVEYVSVEAL